jgi:fumarate reductase (CoM/CoB) subunit A
MESLKEVEKIEAEVLIIGAGVAGMMAAVGAMRGGIVPSVITKGTYASGSSSMARGGHSIAIGHSNPADNPDLFLEDTLQGGYGLNNPRLAKIMCQEATDRTLELDAWGLGLAKLDDGRFDQKQGAYPHRFARLVHCGRLMGKPLMAALSKKTKDGGVEPLQHVMLVDLLKDGNRVVGAWGFRYREGVPIVIHARSMVLTTGGAPQIHELNDSPPTITGDGYAMALRAGAELLDMEFIDYQMITAAPAKLAGYPPHASGFLNEGGYLLNKNGERFMERYDPEKMERSTRSLLNRAVAMELFEGRGTENNAVYIDIRHIFDDANHGASGDIIAMFRKSGVDMEKAFLEVTSGPHTYLGGVRIDEWGRTSVQGLYAGGEASGGIHGANRLGGAALIDSYVFGFRSGMTAACESHHADRPDPRSGHWQAALEELKARYAKAPGDLTPDEWRRQVQREIVTNIGHVRRADRLQEGLDKLDELERVFDTIGVTGDTARERCECLRKSYETYNVIQVARMLGTAALYREESRGGHFRVDFPEQDDKNYLGNMVLWAENGTIKHRLRPVPKITEIAPPPPGVGPTEAQVA